MDMYDARPLSTLLKRGQWFAGLPADLQERILASARPRRFAKDEVIALEGRQPGALMVVLTGLVRLVRQVRHGDEALVYICEPGFWFGEYAVLTDRPALVSVIAKTRVRLLVLSKAEFERIIEAEPRYYRHFAAIIRKGELGDSMYIVVEGQVRVFDGERTITTLGENEIFGELALLDPEPRNASIEAVTTTRLFRLDREAFSELMAAAIEIVRGVLGVLCDRLRKKAY